MKPSDLQALLPAVDSHRLFSDTRLLVISDEGAEHTKVGNLADYLQKGDVLVVNRSATLPSSFRGTVRRSGEPIEIRLAAFQGPDSRDLRQWMAFSFGAGDWREPTEKRGRAPVLEIGDEIVFGDDLSAKVLHVPIDVQFNRVLRIEFQSAGLERALYRHGRPIQYSYLKSDLEVWDQQTIFAGPPISVEPPSAGFQFSWDLLFKLQAKGIEVAAILHSAGISSTGAAHLDQLLPLPEWFEVSEETAELVNRARKRGSRVFALGTTVLRAMESSVLVGRQAGHRDQRLVAASGVTSLKIQPDQKIWSASSLFTGMHEIGTSHMQILNAFCGADAIRRGYEEAVARGYRGHEYGDVSLINCKCG